MNKKNLLQLFDTKKTIKRAEIAGKKMFAKIEKKKCEQTCIFRPREKFYARNVKRRNTKKGRGRTKRKETTTRNVQKRAKEKVGLADI